MWPWRDDAVLVADRSRAGRLLVRQGADGDIRHLISIGHASERPPAGFATVGRRLRLVFADELDTDSGGPAARDVQRLLDFARGVDLARGRLLVQCQAGVSRSAAAAVIVLAAILGPGHEAEIVSWLRRTHPHCRPNLWMLHLADGLLGTGGALARAWRDGVGPDPTARGLPGSGS